MTAAQNTLTKSDVATDALEGVARARLAQWGREFAIDRHGSAHATSTLWYLIHYGGIAPRKAGGPAPLQVDPMVWQIERIISDMHAVLRVEACVMRAYYGGTGRQKIERRALAARLAAKPVSPQQYFAAHDRGLAWVMGALA